MEILKRLTRSCIYWFQNIYLVIILGCPILLSCTYLTVLNITGLLPVGFSPGLFNKAIGTILERNMPNF